MNGSSARIDALKNYVDEHGRDPDFARWLSIALERWRDTSEVNPFPDFVCQLWGKRLDVYGAHVCEKIYNWQQASKLGVSLVSLATGPYPDAMASHNAAVLNATRLVKARVFSGTRDDDGHIETLQPLQFDFNDRVVEIAAGEVFPLEIGFTHPGTTLGHLVREGRLARWPYGRRTLCLWLATQIQQEVLAGLAGWLPSEIFEEQKDA